MGKETLVIIATLMTVAISGLYTWKALFRQTSPHVVTWSLLTLTTGLAWWFQREAGGGLASYVLLVTAMFNATNFLIGLRKRGATDVRPSSLVCVALAVTAIGVHYVTGSPMLATIFLTVGSVSAFAPTVIRTKSHPELEPLLPYVANTVRYFLATIAVAHYSVATMAYTGTWVAVNGAFAAYLFVCRRHAAAGVTCRWCGAGIVPASQVGWVHADGMESVPGLCDGAPDLVLYHRPEEPVPPTI